MSELVGIARFTFHPGGAEEFKRLAQQCMEVVLNQDTGTLQYDIYLNADESEAVVIERYRDSQALIEHHEHIGEELMAQVMATALAVYVTNTSLASAAASSYGFIVDNDGVGIAAAVDVGDAPVVGGVRLRPGADAADHLLERRRQLVERRRAGPGEATGVDEPGR